MGNKGAYLIEITTLSTSFALGHLWDVRKYLIGVFGKLFACMSCPIPSSCMIS